MKKYLMGLIFLLVLTMSFATVGTAGFDSGTDTVAGARPYLQGNFEALGFGTTTSGVTVAGEANKIPILGTTSVLTVSGISFPNSQVINAGSNVLDDYEKGVFTPTLIGVSTGSLTYNSGETYGYYTKVGRLITWTAQITWTAIAEAFTGDLHLILGGLPNAIAARTAATIGGCSAGSLTASGSNLILGAVEPSTNYVNVITTNPQTNAVGAAPTVGATGTIYCASGFYFTD